MDLESKNKSALFSKEELIKELETIAKDGKKRLQAKGISEADLLRIAEKHRGKIFKL